MTTITLTEADRIELPAPQYAGRAIAINVNGELLVDSLTHRGDCWRWNGPKVSGPAYLLPEIKIAEPEKPPGLVQVRNAVTQSQGWAYRISRPTQRVDVLAMSLCDIYHFALGDVRIVPNPKNCSFLAAAIRAAQEWK